MKGGRGGGGRDEKAKGRKKKRKEKKKLTYEMGGWDVVENSGGEEVLLDVGGQDATEAFEDVGHSDEAREVLEKLQIGDLKRVVCSSLSLAPPPPIFFLPLLSCQPPLPSPTSQVLRSIMKKKEKRRKKNST